MTELYFKYDEGISLTCYVLAHIEFVGDIFKDEWGGYREIYKGYYTFVIGKFNENERVNLYYKTYKEAEAKHKELRDLLEKYQSSKIKELEKAINAGGLDE